MKKINIIKVLFVLTIATNVTNAQMISGSSIFSPTAGGARILSAQGNTAANPAIGFQSSISTTSLAQNDGGGGNGIFRPFANTMAFSTTSIERMRISASGTLGINTTTPNSTAGIHMHSKFMMLTGSNSYGGPQILFGKNVTDGGVWGIEYNYSTVGNEGLNFWKPWTAGQAGAQGNYFLFLHNSGRVGINTNNPTAQFTVNGNCLIGTETTTLPAGYRLYVENGILTEKVKIAVKNTSNWADYVFDSNYKRMSLSDLEAFVTSNKHLPNIPSAEEVVKEGIDLGNMSSKLLEKIEELTLYIIEQDKKINELSLEVKKMTKN